MTGIAAHLELTHRFAIVDGVRLHYVEAGADNVESTPVLLLPGWPQSWYAWRQVIPDLVTSGRRVVAVDPRGFGDSDKPSAGYDMATVAAEICGFMDAIGLTRDGPADVAGHDLGVWIGYALASGHPEVVRRLCLIEAVIPGASNAPPTQVPSEASNLRTWHLSFNRLNDLPELLIAGRERLYLQYLFRSKAMDPATIDGAALDEYVRVNSLPGALRAAFTYYRTMFSEEGLASNAARAAVSLQMPVHALGAERGVGSALLETMRQAAVEVSGGVIEGHGHYLPEEAPALVAKELVAFFSNSACGEQASLR